ncbi:MAG TPA: F0F1 ATP synthase subunit delta, partial [bacterium]|nr:F0F1 ATP synthase subunit delta [bacterium]
MSTVLTPADIESLGRELLKIAIRDDAIDLYRDSFRRLIDEVAYNLELRAVWTNEDAGLKKKLILEHLSDRFPERLVEFVYKIIDLKAENFLQQIYLHFIELVNTNQYSKVDIHLPFPIPEERLEEIDKILSEILSKEVICSVKIDSGIINGLKIDLEEEVIDLSLKTQLDILKERLELIQARDSI